MQPPRNHDPFQAAMATAAVPNSAQVADLAVLIDAIPPEYREDVLLSVLWLGTSNVFQESYLVSSIRNQLCDCLMDRTGTLHDLTNVRQLARCLYSSSSRFVHSGDRPGANSPRHSQPTRFSR